MRHEDGDKRRKVSAGEDCVTCEDFGRDCGRCEATEDARRDGFAVQAVGQERRLDDGIEVPLPLTVAEGRAWTPVATLAEVPWSLERQTVRTRARQTGGLF